MTGWVRRLGRYRAMYERILERHGLPKDLIFLAMIESGFEPGAVSRVGAGGVWQFMPAVGRAYGLEVSHWVDARRYLWRPPRAGWGGGEALLPSTGPAGGEPASPAAPNRLCVGCPASDHLPIPQRCAATTFRTRPVA